MYRIAIALFLLIILPNLCRAQSIDALTLEMKEKGLFSPHAYNCDGSTEAFLPLGQGGTSGNTGICIEKSERSAALFDTAIQTCAALGKRLPEMSEWRIACDNAGSLSLINMTNNWEYSSNFSFMVNYTSAARAVAVAGNGGCNRTVLGQLGDGSGVEWSYYYRCVH